MYNIIAVLCVVSPICYVVEFTEDGLFYFASTMIILVSSSLVFSLFAPIVLRYYEYMLKADE